MANKFLQDESNKTEHKLPDQEDSATNNNNYVDFFSMNSICNAYNCNLLSDNIVSDPMFIKVNINDKTIKIEINSGTYFTVMSEDFVNKKFKNLKISKSHTHLVGYEDKWSHVANWKI